MKNIHRKPNIRFKDFNGDWEQCDFKDLAKVRRGLTYKPKDVQKKGVRVLRSSNINEDTFELRSDDIFVNQSALNIKSVDENDILITSANGSSRLVGKHALIKNITGLAVHGGFMLLATSEEPYFTNAFMSSSWYSRFIHIYVSGGNGAIGNLSKSDLDSQKIYIPKQFEQQQIGSFFNTLDNFITLHQRKLEQLELSKKIFLDKLFPKNKNKVPEYRFEGFVDDWEQRKLSDVAEIVGGGTPSTSNDEYWDGDIDWYTPAEINNQIFADSSERKITELGLQKSSAKILPADKTVLFTSRAGIGKMAILRRSGATNQGFQSLLLNDETNPYFIFSMGSMIKESAERVASGSTFAEISGKMLGNLEFMFPNEYEQRKIGEYFQSIDNLITLHQRKLEQLEDMKKYYLKHMFI